MFKDRKIKYFNGTHRVISPIETLENYEAKLKLAGITRIADITYLDRIGIPVFSAIRPTSAEGSISVYAGKGIETEQAKVSAMMEGFERYSAEKQENDKIFKGTINEISEKGNFINPTMLNLPKDFDKSKLNNLTFEWNLATDIVSEEKYFISSNAIYHPYIAPPDCQTLFKGNTNGLASGNVLEEAVLHGMFEVIERDAWSIFELTKKNSKEIDLKTIENNTLKNILSKFKENEIDIKLLDLTADVKIPTIAAVSDDTLLKDPALLTLGIGTHLNPEVAILRALTEVAQSRVTQIHGAREDTVRADFMRKAGYERMKRMNKHYFQKEYEKIGFSDIENKSTTSIKEDILITKDELIKEDLDKILFTNLTRKEVGVNVVRVVIPTMELYSIDRTRLGNRFLNI